MHLFFRYRMMKSYFSGMQHEPLCRNSAVKSITHNRGIQTIRMCRVYPQLMSATCEREKINECTSVGKEFTYDIACDGRLAVYRLYHLTRSVVWVREER